MIFFDLTEKAMTLGIGRLVTFVFSGVRRAVLRVLFVLTILL